MAEYIFSITRELYGDTVPLMVGIISSNTHTKHGIVF